MMGKAISVLALLTISLTALLLAAIDGEYGQVAIASAILTWGLSQ
jgi:hypothetical protein